MSHRNIRSVPLNAQNEYSDGLWYNDLTTYFPGIGEHGSIINSHNNDHVTNNIGSFIHGNTYCVLRSRNRVLDTPPDLQLKSYGQEKMFDICNSILQYSGANTILVPEFTLPDPKIRVSSSPQVDKLRSKPIFKAISQ